MGDKNPIKLSLMNVIGLLLFILVVGGLIFFIKGIGGVKKSTPKGGTIVFNDTFQNSYVETESDSNVMQDSRVKNNTNKTNTSTKTNANTNTNNNKSISNQIKNNNVNK